MKKSLIICSSVHHKNTMKVAKVIAEVLDADVVEPKDFNMGILSKYDLIGFGSGIYHGEHSKTLLNLASNISIQNNKKAFVFSTSTIILRIMHKTLIEILKSKGFYIIGNFACIGFMNYSFTKYFFGGLNKGRPNEKDLREAREFALKLKEDI